MQATVRTRTAVPDGLLAVVVGGCVGLIEILPDAASLGVMAVIGCVAIFTPAADDAPTPRLRALLLASAGFLGAAVLSSLAARSLTAGVHTIGRFALFPLAVIALRRTATRDASLALWGGATFGATMAGLVVFAEVAATDATRPAGMANPITFGGLAVLLGFLSLVTTPLVEDRVPHAARLSLVAATLGVGASLVAQARGSWIVLPVVAVVAGAAHVRSGGSTRAVVVVAMVVALVVPVGLSANGGAGLRALDRAADQTTDYLLGERDEAVRSSSVGARFEMWGSAFGAFRDEPLLGIGWGNLRDRFVGDAATGLRPTRLAEFEHAHNQFVGSLANGGILGLLALLAILGIPGRLFADAFRGTGPAVVVGAAGLGVVGGFVVMGLTEAVFERSTTLVFYGIIVSLLIGQLDRLSRPVESEHMFV